MTQFLTIEWIKLRNTPVWYMIGVFLLLFMYLNYDLYSDFQNQFWKEASMTNDYNPWHFFINSEARKLGFFLGVSSLIIITYLHYIEISNNMMNRIFILPVSAEEIYIAKFIMGLSILFLILLSTFGFILFFIKPQLTNYYSFLFNEKYVENQTIYPHWLSFYVINIVKVMIFQLWLTLKLKQNYLMSLFIGFIGILILIFVKFSPYYLYFSHLDFSWTSDISITFIYLFVFTYFLKKELNDNQ